MKRTVAFPSRNGDCSRKHCQGKFGLVEWNLVSRLVDSYEIECRGVVNPTMNGVVWRGNDFEACLPETRSINLVGNGLAARALNDIICIPMIQDDVDVLCNRIVEILDETVPDMKSLGPRHRFT